MANFDLFRTKMQNSESCRMKYESNFILDGTSAVEIFVPRLNAKKQAALVLTDKEGPDTGLVYTYLERIQYNELLKADYFTWKDNTYFVYEDVDIVREVNYKKQRIYQCNVGFVVGDKCYCAYFMASLNKNVDDTLQKDLIIVDNEKPILIMPTQDWIEIGLRINFGNKTWKIVDFDLITNDQIAYISLDRDFDTTYEDIEVVNRSKASSEAELTAGIEISLPINFGYFKTDKTVDIISKSAKEVKFMIPYGLEELTITTKDIDKVDIIKTYKVVII